MRTCNRLSHLLLELIFFTLFPVFEAKILEVPPEVTGSLGSNVTLPCHFIHSSTKTQINQVQWNLMQPEGKKMIFVSNSEYGVNIPDSPLKGRVNISEQSLTITGVKATDKGSYICSLTTFPNGSFEGMTNLTVVEQTQREDQEENTVHLSAEIIAAVITASVVFLVILAAILYLVFIRRSNSASRLQVLIDTSGRQTNINQPSFIVKEPEVVYAKIKPKPSRDSASSSIKERPGQTEPADDVTYSEVKILYQNPN